MASFNKVSGNLVDVLGEVIYPATIYIHEGKIVDIIKDNKKYNIFIIPGFIDAHIHIESSMLIPSEFARLAVTHGTIGAVCDPHEIANILGIEGIDYMIENGKSVNFKFYFGAPSCVPATVYETAGAELGIKEVEKLLKRKEIKFLGEVMNTPAVISGEFSIMEKINSALKYGKKIDGHAPGLKGKELKKYIATGISTDHECNTKEEALEKLKYGMKIMIREGSAAKNFDNLVPLIKDYPNDCMFCSDDKHPDDLVIGHINELVKRALKAGFDKMKVLKCASVNPVLHYGLDIGLLQKGDPADFVIIDNFEDFNILITYINGKIVAENGKSLLPQVKTKEINNFKAEKKEVSEFYLKKLNEKIEVIEVIDGQLITDRLQTNPKIVDNKVVSDPIRDILKIVVVNRYQNLSPAIGFIKNFGLKKGAIASSVAHDSHNIIAVGVTDEDICRAVNLIIENKGGICVVYDKNEEILPLPIAGIMTYKDGYKVADEYSRLDKLVKSLGSTLNAPFMSLSFMALLVIPKLKLSDKGLFDAERFEFIN